MICFRKIVLAINVSAAMLVTSLEVNAANIFTYAGTAPTSISAGTITGCVGGTCPAAITIPLLNEVDNTTPVSIIGDFAFEVRGLTSVVIQNSVISIGTNAFAANQLTSVNIPNSVTTLESGAFRGNPMTSVIIPNSVTTIGPVAFYINNLTTVTIPSSVISIGSNAFGLNNLLDTVLFEGNFPAVDPNAFTTPPLQTIYYRTGSTGFSSPLLGGITPTLLAAGLTLPLAPPRVSAVPTSTPFTLLILMGLLGLIAGRYGKAFKR